MSSIPMFFGSQNEPLYGVYHPGQNKQLAVLICPPVGYEYMRSHRAIKTLSQRCQKGGIASFRFDYRGTGNSAGDLEKIRLADWLSDTRNALYELRSLSGAKEIAVLGLRFGALIVSHLSAEESGIKKVYLWDPVITGSEFIEEMRKAEEHLQDQKDPYLNKRTPKADQDNLECLLGYPFSNLLLEDIIQSSLFESLDPDSRILMFLSRSMHLEPDWQLESGSFQQRIIESPGNWCEIDNFGSVLLPQSMIQEISEELIANG